MVEKPDAAEGIVLATERYGKPDPVNLGTGIEISIQELSTGFQYGGGRPVGPTLDSPTTQRLALSYVAGSHAFKVGQQLRERVNA